MGPCNRGVSFGFFEATACLSRQLPIVYGYLGSDDQGATDFVEDDLGMARRALWLLEWPSRLAEEPRNIDLSRLSNFRGRDGALLPLANCALIRQLDAVRAGGSSLIGERATRGVIQTELDEARAEAGRVEKKANELLREARRLVGSARAFWQAASEKRAADYAVIPVEFQTGEHQEVLAEVLAAEQATEQAFDRMNRAVRRAAESDARDWFPSMLGLTKIQRKSLLNTQALRLHEAGHSLDQIAYVMGWNGGSAQHARDRTRKRREEARAHESAQAAPAGAR